MTPKRFRLTPERKAQFREMRRDPKGIRKWLKARRKEASPTGEALIWHALFGLYGIPDGEYQWLAGRLAAELFPRCGPLWKPHGGGPSKKRQAMFNKRKLALHKKFETFRRERPKLSRVRAAELFMADAKNRRACEKAGFTSPKAFAQAMKEIGSGTISQ